MQVIKHKLHLLDSLIYLIELFGAEKTETSLDSFKGLLLLKEFQSILNCIFFSLMHKIVFTLDIVAFQRSMRSVQTRVQWGSQRTENRAIILRILNPHFHQLYR